MFSMLLQVKNGKPSKSSEEPKKNEEPISRV